MCAYVCVCVYMQTRALCVYMYVTSESFHFYNALNSTLAIRPTTPKSSGKVIDSTQCYIPTTLRFSLVGPIKLSFLLCV